MQSSPDYVVLARKYRPQSLNDVVGQEILVSALEKAISSNQLSHGILLHGIRGIGKTTTARIIAKGLNCEKGPTINPCGVCGSCNAIQQDRHLDVIEMDAASHTGVDDMREIIETAKYRAVQGKFKIYIIDEVHMLSKSAFNALLKTLEEPPPNVKFIFATTELQKVPDTILSRCMRFDLKRMETKTIEERMFFIASKENLSLDEEAATLIARAAEGSMRDALSLFDQSIVLSKTNHITGNIVRNMLGLSSFEATTSLLRAIFKGEEHAIFEHTHSLFHQGTDPLLLLRDIVERVYQMICMKTHPELLKGQSSTKTFFTEHERQLLAPLVQTISMPSLLQTWQLLNDRYAKVERSPLPQQSVQVALLQVCYVSQLPPLKELLEGNCQLPESSPPPSKVIEISHPVLKTSPEPYQNMSSFEDILTLLKEKREPLLYSHVYNDIAIKSFAPGIIQLHRKPSIPPSILQQLKHFLDQHTKLSWQIEDLGVSLDALSLKDHAALKKESLRNQAINHATVQTILDTFKGATILPGREE